VEPNYLAATRFVIQHTETSEPIYVGASRHDRFLMNAVSLYFMASRRPATRWHELHPGIQTTEEVQRAMIAEFESQAPRLIVVDNEWDGIEEPNQSRVPTDIRLLDDYVATHFAIVARFGAISILTRR
jgi:hypothetical protein